MKGEAMRGGICPKRCVGLASLSSSRRQHRSVARVLLTVMRGCVGVLAKVGAWFPTADGRTWGGNCFPAVDERMNGGPAMATFPIHEDLRDDTRLPAF